MFNYQMVLDSLAPAGDNDDDDEDQADNLIQSTQIVQVKLADQQADPNSPLYSVKSFDDLGL
jgi:ATP-dependent RNA helicase DDX19/DBP5